MIEDMTTEEAVELAAEIADPDFIETYRRMKRTLVGLRGVNGILVDYIGVLLLRGPVKVLDGPPAFRKPEGVK